MQAIILAAGLSKRLRPLTDSSPKCLLKIGGMTILELIVKNILKNGINEFVIVTGYREDMIKDFVKQNFSGIEVVFITNNNYENNNNSYSLWLTRNYIKGDCLLLDSDILFDHRIILKLLDSPHADCLAAKKDHALGAEEIKVIIDSSNKILHIGKHLSIADSFGESIGIERFTHSFFSKLGEVLERKIIQENNVNEFYESSFQELYDKGNAMYAVDVSEYECIEIDYPEDLEKAALKINKMEL